MRFKIGRFTLRGPVVVFLLFGLAAGALEARPRRTRRLRPQRETTVFPADAGPDTIQVEGYPAEIKRLAPFFKKTCSRCHTIARPLNTFMSPEMWKFYLTKGMVNPRYQVTQKALERLVLFILYDQKHRKDPNPSRFFKPVTIREKAPGEAAAAETAEDDDAQEPGDAD